MKILFLENIIVNINTGISYIKELELKIKDKMVWSFGVYQRR